ncbi:hypothetical protein SEPCBS119000_002881 [Sporothrix epigloea]|uniref:Involucrin repeat protein n=1 Tax=Sporothrix epigloea TaxID=1892477 RepID=A0ABP0DIK0_9PEZI
MERLRSSSVVSLVLGLVYAVSNGSAGGSAGAATASTGSSASGSSSTRRRGGGVPGSGVASSSHVLRTTSAAAAAAAASAPGTGAGSSSVSSTGNESSNQKANSGAGSSSAANGGGATGSAGSVIAPPPRVALGSGSQNTSNAPNSSSGPNGGSPAGSGNGGGGSSGGGSSGSGNAGGGGGGSSSISASGSGGSSKDTHFVYTSNHHNHHQRHQNHHNYHGQHSTSPQACSSPSASAAAAQASVHASAASAQIIKEKDARIGQLEHELRLMETEFTRELDKLSKAEAETATFWQAKHGRLQQQLAQADTEIQLLRAEVDLRGAERTELRAGWEEMQRAAIARDEEARSLREQVRRLKEWVSTSTRTSSQVASDEVFADGMACLANSLQNWVIVYFRRAKLTEIDDGDKTSRDALAQLVPMYKELRHSAKLHLLQSAVSRILVDLVFDSYFIGLPSDQAAQFSQVEALLNVFAGSAEPINEWRALTLAIISKDAGQQLPAEMARVADDVVARVNEVLDSITDVQRSDTRDQALRQLVASALELARLLMAQKAIFRVIMPPVVPHQQVLFDAATMEDIGAEEVDDDGLSQREIACVTFPGIIKRGDETGGHLQYTNVICKARVLCAAE